jgi:hypothetical protein
MSRVAERLLYALGLAVVFGPALLLLGGLLLMMSFEAVFRAGLMDES